MEYVIGLDFGTLSARGVLISKYGEEVCTAEYVYPRKSGTGFG